MSAQNPIGVVFVELGTLLERLEASQPLAVRVCRSMVPA